mmetsp:Transcript_6795/g.26250  ORF Transcript_6795/g.26250 Transcript_6795/m.26250 type:complete len:220 (+) Transcript_6795:536-1195(+)
MALLGKLDIHARRYEKVHLWHARNENQKRFRVAGEPDMVLQQVRLQRGLANIMKQIRMPCSELRKGIAKEHVTEQRDRRHVRIGGVVVQLSQRVVFQQPVAQNAERAEASEAQDGILPGRGHASRLRKERVAHRVVQREDHAQNGAVVIKTRSKVPLVLRTRHTSHDRFLANPGKKQIEETQVGVPHEEDEDGADEDLHSDCPLRAVHALANAHAHVRH